MAVELFNLFKPNAVIIEDKSAGSSLIQYLNRSTTLPVIAFEPKGDKEVRATAATPTVKAGKCFLPVKPIKQIETVSGKEVDVLEAFINEHLRFPKASHDDTVDTTSMMVEHFNRRSLARPRVRSL
jgi:predicted phage terminase large subunit-like protein